MGLTIPWLLLALSFLVGTVLWMIVMKPFFDKHEMGVLLGVGLRKERWLDKLVRRLYLLVY